MKIIAEMSSRRPLRGHMLSFGADLQSKNQ